MNESKHPAGHVLQAYNDGELDPSAAGEVADHCKHCEICRTELAELEGMGRLLAGIPAPELPKSVWHSVRPGRERESRFIRPALAVAACAAGIIIGVLLGPVKFSAEETVVETAWSETVTVWNVDASSSLLDVYQTEQE